mmetsp:Transcript_16959/g.33855  ORF Transcript_16959/g.33855 Transcript_16959/m.33855 type:complete len:200 (-) Transcript_16959:420-1019(-)
MFLPNGSPAGRATDHPAATKSTAGGHAPPRPLCHVPVEYFCISVGSSIPTVPPHGSSKWITDASPPLEVGWYGSWFRTFRCRTFRTHVRTAGSSSISLWLVLQVPPASLRTRTCPIPPFGGSVRSHPPSTARAAAAVAARTAAVAARAAAVAATRGAVVLVAGAIAIATAMAIATARASDKRLQLQCLNRLISDRINCF